VEDVGFVVADAPRGLVRTVAPDNYQPATWYAGGGEQLFRSTNDGLGWELVAEFAGEKVRQVVPAPLADRPGITPRPGAVAAVTNSDEGGSCLYVSADIGETWRKVAEVEATVLGAAWIDRQESVALLLATDVGLYELSLLEGSVPLQVSVDAKDADRGFYSVVSFVSEKGVWGVALAAQGSQGVYLSSDGGRTFAMTGLSGSDTRALAVQTVGPDTILWAATATPDPNKPGKGCFRARLFEADVRWMEMSAGWTGGTCWGLAFTGRRAYAASQSAGVLSLDTAAAKPQWETPSVNCGLPLRDRTRFEPVQSVAVNGKVFVGGSRGVYAQTSASEWVSAASAEPSQLVTIPPTWLLVSGEHDIEVVAEHGS
jgi:hypothetical protein